MLVTAAAMICRVAGGTTVQRCRCGADVTATGCRDQIGTQTDQTAIVHQPDASLHRIATIALWRRGVCERSVRIDGGIQSFSDSDVSGVWPLAVVMICAANNVLVATARVCEVTQRVVGQLMQIVGRAPDNRTSATHFKLFDFDVRCTLFVYV